MSHFTILLLSHQYFAIISPFISPPLITITSLTIMSPFHQYLTIVSPVSHQYLTSISPVFSISPVSHHNYLTILIIT